MNQAPRGFNGVVDRGSTPFVAGGMPIRHTWSESDRLVPRVVVRPLHRLLADEAAGAVVMLVAAALAIVWANSPWRDSYVDLWSTPLQLELGELLHLDHLSLQAWVNDALMTIFFLLVGVEIKREVVHGQLRDLRTVALPVIAALGGMVVPALIYVAFTTGGVGSNGWGIPMATDIAFAVGVVTLAGPRVPLAAKVFLLTLAVADDVGAIVVIAIFYTGELSAGWLVVALVGLSCIWLLRRGDVQALAPYLAVGAFVWVALLESGVHATLVGVALGLLTPAWPLRSPRRFPASARRLLHQIEAAYYDQVLTQEEFESNEQHIAEIARLAMYSTSPLERLERALRPWVAFVILPLFALANAGVELSAGAVADLGSDAVTLGVLVGLVVGKTVGVLGAAALATRLGIGRLPAGTTWRHMLGLAACAGIGFTVALFVTGISFDDAQVGDAAKVGILAGSAFAGIVGYLLLRSCPPTSFDDRLPTLGVAAPHGAHRHRGRDDQSDDRVDDQRSGVVVAGQQGGLVRVAPEAAEGDR
jgi:NhaA family Na+:H+ antiporter